MKKKNLFIILALIFCLSSVNSAWAGNVQRNRWEGVAIGIGAAILGYTLYQYSVPAQPKVNQHYQTPTNYDNRYRQKPSGHWETRKVWVQPTYESVWSPGHYNHSYGRGVRGHMDKH